MQDTAISNYTSIVRAVKAPIWNLCQQSEKYGTGFDLWRTGKNQITLELMDDCAKYGCVIDRIVLDFNVDVSDVTEMSANGWASHVTALLEKRIFDKRAEAV